MERLREIIRLTKCNTEPFDIIGELECEDVHKDNRPEKKRGRGDPVTGSPGSGCGSRRSGAGNHPRSPSMCSRR